MNKKLTLNIDDALIEFARDYSKKTRQSISAIVEKYFKSLEKSASISELSQTTRELHGILTGKDLPDKKVMRKAFHDKNLA